MGFPTTNDHVGVYLLDAAHAQAMEALKAYPGGLQARSLGGAARNLRSFCWKVFR